MPSALRVAAVSLALGLITQDALANIVPIDASLEDAMVVGDEPGADAAAQADAGDADAPAQAAPDATTVVPDASSTSISIPSATGLNFSAPDTSSDDGCNATSSSSGAVPALGLLAVLGLVRSRRRR